jgi:hypothetical protein
MSRSKAIMATAGTSRLQEPQDTDGPSAVLTLAVNLQQIRWAMKALHPPRPSPMSNIAFDMAAATLSNGSLRDIISNAPAPR